MLETDHRIHQGQRWCECEPKVPKMLEFLLLIIVESQSHEGCASLLSREWVDVCRAEGREQGRRTL